MPRFLLPVTRVLFFFFLLLYFFSRVHAILRFDALHILPLLGFDAVAARVYATPRHLMPEAVPRMPRHCCLRCCHAAIACRCAIFMPPC